MWKNEVSAASQELAGNTHRVAKGPSPVDDRRSRLAPAPNGGLRDVETRPGDGPPRRGRRARRQHRRVRCRNGPNRDRPYSAADFITTGRRDDGYGPRTYNDRRAPPGAEPPVEGANREPFRWGCGWRRAARCRHRQDRPL